MDVAVLGLGGHAEPVGLREIAETEAAPARLTRAALLVSRTSAVTSWPPLTSASSTAAPSIRSQTVRKIRISEAV